MISKKSINSFFKKTLPLLCLSMLMTACFQDNGSRAIESLNVGILPDQSESQIRKKYQPLLDYIESNTKFKEIKLIIPKTYSELLSLFRSKQIDMAMFGGVTYVKANIDSGAIPIVMRNVDGNFKSVALVHANNPAESIIDIKGGVLAFGSELSTSGHFMPRYYLQEKGIVPELYFSKMKYSGAHDLTAEWVRDGKVDIGFSNSGIVNEMFLDGRLTVDKVKVIWESPPFPDYVWALQADIEKYQRAQIRDAFFNLSRHSEDKELLKSLGADYYIPVGQGDFKRLSSIVMEMEGREAK